MMLIDDTAFSINGEKVARLLSDLNGIDGLSELKSFLDRYQVVPQTVNPRGDCVKVANGYITRALLVGAHPVPRRKIDRLIEGKEVAN